VPFEWHLWVPLQYKNKKQLTFESLASQPAATSCKNIASNPHGSSAAALMRKALVSSLHSAWSSAEARSRSYNDVTSADLYPNIYAVQVASDGLKADS
jgi:hypothetical protein